MLLLYGTLISLLAVTVVNSQACTNASIAQCQSAFDNSHVLLAPQPLDARIPAWNETLAQLKDRCSRYTQFSLCMKTVTPNCDSTLYDYFSGLDYAYSYLCNSKNASALQAFVAYETCFSQTMEGTQFCLNSYSSKVGSLISGYTSQSTAIQNLCQYTDTYIQCMNAAVSSSTCGSAAGAWEAEWLTRLLYYQMTDAPLNCPGWGDYSDNSATIIWTVILSVILGLTLLVMVVGVIIIFIFVQRKKRCIHRSGLVPPPPYSSTNPYMMYGNVEHDLEDASPTGDEPAASSLSEGASTTVAIRALPKIPVQPPPYTGQEAPAYDAIQAAGARNAAFHGGEDDEEDEKKVENGISENVAEVGEIETRPTQLSAPEHDINNSWF